MCCFREIPVHYFKSREVGVRLILGDLKLRERSDYSHSNGSRGWELASRRMVQNVDLCYFFSGSGLWDDVTGIHALVNLVRKCVSVKDDDDLLYACKLRG